MGIYDNADGSTGPKHANSETFREGADDYNHHYGSHSWNDIVQQLQQHVAQHGKIDKLYIFDHGYSDIQQQQFGDDPVEPQSFAALKPLLAPGAIIILVGCDVGANPAYCISAAYAAGAKVVASDEDVYHIDGGSMWGDDFGSYGKWHAFDGNGELPNLPLEMQTAPAPANPEMKVGSAVAGRSASQQGDRFIVTVAPPAAQNANRPHDTWVVKLY